MPRSTALAPPPSIPASSSKPDSLAHLAGGLHGNDREYRAFLAGLASWLKVFIAKQVPRSPEEVDDLVQEALLAIHNKRSTYDSTQPLDVWVQAIARYKVVDFLRRTHAVVDPINGSQMSSGHGVNDGDLGGIDARIDVHKLLSGLPEKQRRAILYLKVEGLSVAESAVALGMSPVAVKVCVHRGLKAIAAKWKARK
jgi:RNA polymerase sigma-70 factor (ECF subfamily)